MSKTYVQPGDVMNYANGSGSDIASGEVIDLNTRIGVAKVDIADGEAGAVDVEGVHELASETGVAWAQGDALYWDGTELTKTVSSNTPAGYAFEAKLSATAVGLVKLQG